LLDNGAMSLFVAIVPPSGALAELAEVVDPLRAAEPGLRWTGADEWHLTLAFLGEVAETVVPELTGRLERAAGRHPGQSLSLRGGGAFPKRSKATVLWAGIAGDRQALAVLAASVAAGARRAGAPSPDEGRPFRGHVTLARSRQPADLTALVAALDGLDGSGWPASAIALIRSHPPSQAHGRPRYEQLGSWPLGRADPADR
jgi:2'-5' RNA ligase